MSDTSRYSSPEIAEIGSAAEITEDISSPVTEGYAGSGKYYDSSKADREEETPAEGGDSSSSEESET
jgi:hypothetical protein